MFSREPEQRRAAAQQLATELRSATGTPILHAMQGEPYTLDPFRVGPIYCGAMSVSPAWSCLVWLDCGQTARLPVPA